MQSKVTTGWPWLIAGVVLLAVLQLWLRPLLPVDETRYLSAAWDMWWRGEFLVPHLNGEAYSHKPPLLFWLMHTLWSVAGVSELAARLIPPGLSLLALWWAALLAERLWPDADSRLKALVPWLLFGGVFWINFYTLVQFDLLLVLAALAAWLGVLRARSNPLRGWVQVALAIGLGVLSKGPVILLPVLPALLLAPWWMSSSPGYGWWRWYAGAGAALVAGAAVALIWAVPAGLAGGEAYQQAIFWGQSAGRMVKSFAHQSPWWSYLLWLPLMWLPWVLWPAVWRGLRGLSLQDEGVRFCAAVLLPALVLFSVISGKQGKYLLPLFPLIALMLARALTRMADNGKTERMWPAGILLVLLGLVLTALPVWPHGPDWVAGMQLMWGPALLVWAAPFFLLRVNCVVAVRGMVLGIWLGTATVYLGIVPLLAPNYQLQPLSQSLAQLQGDARPIAWLGKYHAQFNFLGRLRVPVEALNEPGSLQAWLAAHPEGYLLVRYPSPEPEVPRMLQRYPYRSGSLVLWPVKKLLESPAQLDALAGNA